MRKELAGVRPDFIDGAEIAIEKDTAVFVALENAPFIFGFNRIVVEKDGELDAQKTGQVFGIALADRGGGHAATIGASGAIDFFLNILGDRFEAALYEVVTFQPGAETLIFGTLLFAKALDLDEVGEHCS